MVTNLVFKRTVNIEGSSRTEMKIIEVNIPELKSNEGWTLVSSADKVTTINLPRETGEKTVKTEVKEDITKNRDADPDKATEFLTNLIAGMSQTTETVTCKCAQTDESTLEKLKQQMAAQSVNVAYKPSESRLAEEAASIKEYPSTVQGTAWLIRSNNTIKIAFRKGKKANINTPNRICISDYDKQSFFNAVRACNPTDIITAWSLSPKDHHFKYWNQFIDNEYQEQKLDYIRREKSRKGST